MPVQGQCFGTLVVDGVRSCLRGTEVEGGVPSGGNITKIGTLLVAIQVAFQGGSCEARKYG